MSDEVAPGLPELLLLITNCYLLLANLKFVTFVTRLPKVVTFSLDKKLNRVSSSSALFLQN